LWNTGQPGTTRQISTAGVPVDESIRIAPLEDFHGAIPLEFLGRGSSQKALHSAHQRQMVFENLPFFGIIPSLARILGEPVADKEQERLALALSRLR
jgi:hypothetical protein